MNLLINKEKSNGVEGFTSIYISNINNLWYSLNKLLRYFSQISALGPEGHCTS